MAQAEPLTMRLQVKLEGIERLRAFLAVQDELEHQARVWGGPAHDDAHSLAEWLGFLRATLRKAELALRSGRVLQGRGPGPEAGPKAVAFVQAMRRASVEQVLDELRQVAALAVAALESQDRQGLRVRTRSEAVELFKLERAAALRELAQEPGPSLRTVRRPARRARAARRTRR